MPTVYEGKRAGRTRGRPEDRATAAGSVKVDDWQRGHAGSSEVWDVDTDAILGWIYMGWKLKSESNYMWSEGIDPTANVAAFKTGMETIDGVDVATVTGAAGAWVVTFDDDKGEGLLEINDQSAFSGPDNAPPTVSSTTLDTLGIADLDGMIAVVVDGDTNTFTLTYGAQTTSALDETTSAAQLETALELLSSITAVTVTGSGKRLDPFEIMFVNPVEQSGITFTLGTWENTIVPCNRLSAPNSDRE